VKGAIFELGKENTWVVVSAYRVRDPLDGRKYYATVMMVDSPASGHYEIHASENQKSVEKIAKVMAKEALEAMRERDRRRTIGGLPRRPRRSSG